MTTNRYAVLIAALTLVGCSDDMARYISAPEISAVVVAGASSFASTTGSSSALTIAAPAVSSGDVLIAQVVVTKLTPQQLICAPAGWTSIQRTNNKSGATEESDVVQETFYRVAASASDAANQTWSFRTGCPSGGSSVGGKAASGGIMVFSGIDNAAPIEVSGGAAGTSSTGATAPAVTTTSNDAQVLRFVGFFKSDNVTPAANRVYVARSTSHAERTAAAWSESQAVAGSTGSYSTNHSSAVWVAQTVVLAGVAEPVGPIQLAFTSSALSGTINQCLGPVTVESRDEDGTATAVTGNTSVALTTDGAGAFYSDAVCSNTITTTQINASNSSAAPFYYSATSVGSGSHEVTAAADGLESASQVETITQAASTTTVASSAVGNTSAFGESVTFTASVTGSIVTAGSVTFKSGGTSCTDGTLLQTATTVNGSGQVTYTTTGLGVGTHIIRGCYGGSANYSSSEGDLVYSVEQAGASVDLSGLNQDYDGTARVVGATTTPASLTVDITYDGSPTAPTNAGSYTVVATISDPDYEGSATGTLVVSPKAASVTPAAGSKEYGEDDPAFSGSLSGFLITDGVSATYSRTAGEAGGNYTISATLSPGGVLGNYDITYNTANFTINKAPLTITASSPADIVYGAAAPAVTAGYAGFKFSDNAASLATQPTCGTAYTVGSPVGPHGTSCSGAVSGNYAFTYVGGEFNVTAKPITVKADAKSKVYGTDDPSLTYQITVGGALVGSDAFTGSLARDAGEDVGTYSINQNTLALSANYTLSYEADDLTITAATLTVTAPSPSRQYSDPNPDLAPSYSGFGNEDTATDLDTAPTCTTTATITSGPGEYPVTCTGGADGNYTFSYVAGTLTVTREDARADYTGALFASTSSTTSSSATVTLSATIRDITAATGDPNHDSDAGDIRNATVTFVNRDNGNATLCTANLAVGLVDVSDLKTGTVTCSWSANIGTASSTSFTIGILVNGWYTRDNSADNTVVTVSKPENNMITGGGYLMITNSAGQKAAGTGTKNNFGFNVKYNKSGRSLQGNINTIIRNGGRVYQIKGNAMTSLSVNPADESNPATAVFNGKANIQDITDPGNPVSVDGNATLQVTMTDFGEPGSQDRIAITVWNKQGGLWFASHWDGVRTLEQLLGGGNLVAR